MIEMNWIELLYRFTTILLIWAIVWAIISFWIVGIEFWFAIVPVPLVGIMAWGIMEEAYRNSKKPCNKE